MLRDHFHPPWSEQNPWEGFHSAWANTMVRHLNLGGLPRGYRAMPIVHLPQDVFEVRVFDDRHGMRPVAVVELISPGNKDRPDSRQAFVAMCAAYLQDQINLVMVDVVTTRHVNLHRELCEYAAVKPRPLFSLLTRFAPPNPDLYCVCYRNRKTKGRWYLEYLPFLVAVGSVLPTVLLWLAGDLCVPLDLEATYEETCRVLRIGSGG